VVSREPARDLQFAYGSARSPKSCQLIAQRRAEPEEHFDYLAMLMTARDKESARPMPERELIDEVMTLIVAGHETTAVDSTGPGTAVAAPEAEARLHAEMKPRRAGSAGARADGSASVTQQV